MEVYQLKREYDMKIQQNHSGQIGTIMGNNKNYRYAILNEVNLFLNFVIINSFLYLSFIKITGPGLTKYLDTAGNVLVLIDELDGDHQKLGMFGTETTSSNIK
jgi:hypothetical protein